MQFDCDGNLYVYEPGAGCSGISHKIPQGFSQEDLKSDKSLDCHSSGYVSQDISKDLKGLTTLKSSNIHKSVPKIGVTGLPLRKKIHYTIRASTPQKLVARTKIH